MSTINISLPKTQVELVDNLVTSFGFSNRSEFIRALLRFFTRERVCLKEAVVFPFALPQEKSRSKIIKGFGKTGKYSVAFLKDLEQGLKNSDYFTK